MFRLLFWAVIIGVVVFGYYELEINKTINDGVHAGKVLIVQTGDAVRSSDAYQHAKGSLGTALGVGSH